MEYIKYTICIIIILITFYFAQLSNRMQNKSLRKMQNELKLNDNIITYSGLTGKIIEILEDRVVIETNPDKIKLSIEKWAVAGIDERNIY